MATKYYSEWKDSDVPAACEIRYMLKRYLDHLAPDSKRRLEMMLELAYNGGAREGKADVIERISNLVIYQ